MEQLIMVLFHEATHVSNALQNITLTDPTTDEELNPNAQCDHIAMHISAAWISCEACCSGLSCECETHAEYVAGHAGRAQTYCPSNNDPLPHSVTDCCCN
jgi:hypothetical protein